MDRLTPRENFEIRKFTIVSIIRMLSEYDFSNTSVAGMTAVSRLVRGIYASGGSIGDEAIITEYEKYVRIEG